MARTELVPQSQLTHSLSEIVFVAGDSANGMFFKNNGFRKIIIKTGAGSTGTTTVKSVLSANRRLGDVVLTNGVSKIYESSFFEIMLFNNGGNVDIDISDDTDYELAIVDQQV